MKAQAEALNDLRETLGDHHDLHVLAEFAAARGGLTPEALKDLTARTAEKQKKLRRRAEEEFDRLFAETPGAFAARLAAYLARPVTKPMTEARKRRESPLPPS